MGHSRHSGLSKQKITFSLFATTFREYYKRPDKYDGTTCCVIKAYTTYMRRHIIHVPRNKARLHTYEITIRQTRTKQNAKVLDRSSQISSIKKFFRLQKKTVYFLPSLRCIRKKLIVLKKKINNFPRQLIPYISCILILHYVFILHYHAKESNIIRQK